MNATACEEEGRSFLDRYIDSVKTPDECMLRSNREMRVPFGRTPRDRFVRCPDFPLQVFRNYLADFPRLGAAEVAIRGCGYWMRSLWRVEAGQSQQVARTRWFSLRSVLEAVAYVCTYSDGYDQPLVHPGSVTKGVITLLKKGGKHGWVGLDEYRSITLLNTGLKILAQVLANRLQLFISDVIVPERTFTVKGRSIQEICTWFARS